jgi:redox-sensitive bicupin YhaK (pirin superfamily)
VGTDGVLSIHQDMKLFASLLETNKKVEHVVKKGRGVWLQVVNGLLTLNGVRVRTGDGASVEDEGTLEIVALEASEFLLFDLVQ